MKKYEFQVGDRVRIRSWNDMKKEFTVDDFNDIKVGDTYLVKSMKPLCGKAATIKAICRDGQVMLTNWNIQRYNPYSFVLEMLEPAFIVGNYYQIGGHESQYKDTVVKVTASDNTGFDYEGIHSKPEWGHVLFDSRFADWFEPLCGKQIGKAMRAYDVAHESKTCKAKHVYNGEEVRQAKQICKDLIAEVIEKSTDDIDVNFHNCTAECVSCLIMGETVKAGFAHCSPQDVPSKWIGRCVAICRALKKPIPSFITKGGKENAR